MAKTFDSLAPDGSPVVQRPPVPQEQKDAIVRYLESAPIALAARGFDVDTFDPGGAANVPMTYHTDGTWIWPGAVGYYLRHHDVPPEPELVNRIRGAAFQVPEVGEDALKAAVDVITRPAPPQPPATEPPAAQPPAPGPSPAAPEPSSPNQASRAIISVVAVVAAIAVLIGGKAVKNALRHSDGPDRAGGPAERATPSAGPGDTSPEPPPGQGRPIEAVPEICDAITPSLPSKAKGIDLERGASDDVTRRFCRWRILSRSNGRDLSVEVETNTLHGPARAAETAVREFGLLWENAGDTEFHKSRERLQGLGDEAFASHDLRPIVKGPSQAAAMTYWLGGATVAVRKGNITIKVSWAAADSYKIRGKALVGTYLAYASAKEEAIKLAKATLAQLPT